MSTESDKPKVFETSIMTAGVVGIAFVLLKYRKSIFKNIVNFFHYKNPLKSQKIEVIDSKEQCHDAVRKIQLGCLHYRVLGFDCEWVTQDGHRHPVALLQLASHDGFCALFRLCKIRCIPQELKNILEDLTILKVGVAPIEDAKYLFQDYDVKLNGAVDLRHLAVEASEKPEGLSSLSKTHLNVQLDKNWRIRCSNWEAESLTTQQLNYAATDAHVGVEIFKILSNKILNLKHGVSWSWKYIDEKWMCIDELCRDYVNLKFKLKKFDSGIKNKFLPKTNGGTFENILSSQQQESLGQPNFKQPKRNYQSLARSRPLYQNCYMQKQNGDILCTCDMKKAKWYVDKELASVVCEDPFTIRLNFKPAGEGVVDVDKYYQMPRANQCVVCGKTHSYLRKNVVPREYRKLFPVVMKTHTSHDVLLLCTGCHQLSNSRDQMLRQRLGDLCNAPCDDRNGTKYIKNHESQMVASAAKALLEATKKHVIPPERREQLKNEILHYFEATELTEDLLLGAYRLDWVQENPDYESHGRLVVQHYSRQPGGLFQLEMEWRQHFLDSMRPMFMPELWSVDHNRSRLEIRFSEGRLAEDVRVLSGFGSEDDLLKKESVIE